MQNLGMKFNFSDWKAKKQPLYSALLAVMFFVWIIGNLSSFARATVSGQFLEIEMDARISSLGTASLGMSGDAAMLWKNPAGIFSLEFPEIKVSYRRGLEDINFGGITSVFPLSKKYGTLGMGLMTLYGGKISLLDKGEVITQQDYVINGGYALDISSYIGCPLALGVNVKYLHSTLVEEFVGQAVAGDFGFRLGLPVNGLALGGVVKNFGTSLNYDEATEELPLVYGGGLSWVGALPRDFYLMVNTDAGHRQEIFLNTGMELSYKKIIYLRGGYRFFQDTSIFSSGIGVDLYQLKLDYAFLGNELGAKHLVAFGYRFGPRLDSESKLKPRKLSLAAPGIALFKQGRLKEAVNVWQAALDKHPENPAVKKYLQGYSSTKRRWLKERNKRAQALAEQDDFISAAQIWLDNLKSFPQDTLSLKGLAKLRHLAQSYVRKARALKKKKQWMRAITELEQALKVVPRYSAAIKMRKSIHAILKRKKIKKQRLITSTIKQTQQLTRLRKISKAISLIEYALAAMPRNSRLLKARAGIPAAAHKLALKLKQERKYRQALQLWTDIIETVPDFKPAKSAFKSTELFYQVKILSLDKKALEAYQRKDYREASALWDKCFKLNPEAEMRAKLVRACLAQGILEYRRDNLLKAVTYWERVIKLKPGHLHASKYLKRAYNKIEFYKNIGLEVSGESDFDF